MALPQSRIFICSGVNLNPSYEHTLYFDNADAQHQYFAGKVVKTFSAYTYLRKNFDIDVSEMFDNAVYWSYLFFDNGGKTYYYFITDVQYINDSTVRLSIEMDVMQTYLFNYELLPCFVEREHTDNDTIGNNTVDEGLELGEFYINDQSFVNLSDLCIMIMSTIVPHTATAEYSQNMMSVKYDGMFSGVGIYAVSMDKYRLLGELLDRLDGYGKSECIINMWMYPKALVKLGANESWGDDILCHAVEGMQTFEHVVNSQRYLQGYAPRNNKLFTYPYNFMYATNNAGGAGVYRYERFLDGQNCKFTVAGSVSPDGCAVMFPHDYNGAVENFEEGLTLAGFPSCAWDSDTYKLWLAQNQSSHTLSMATGVLMVAGGIASQFIPGVGTVAGVGSIAGGIGMIANAVTTNKDQSLQPPQSKGAFSNTVNTACGHQTFTVQKKSVDKQHAEIIDGYFDLYGYAVKRVKIPHRNVRENWTYTKTINCKINSNINTNDIQKIESIYNNGITFWVDGDKLGDYSQPNAVKG